MGEKGRDLFSEQQHVLREHKFNPGTNFCRMM